MRKAKRVLAVAVALAMGLMMAGCKGGTTDASTEPVSTEEAAGVMDLPTGPFIPMVVWQSSW